MLWVTIRTVLWWRAWSLSNSRLSRSRVQRVELAKGLVHQQQARLVDQGTRQHDTLVHTAGKLARIGLLETVQPHQFQQVESMGTILIRDSFLLNLERQQHIVEDRAPRHQVCLLEDKPDVGPGRCQTLPVKPERAAVGQHQAADDAQQRALAGAGGAKQADKLACIKAKADRLQHGKRPCAVGKCFRYVFDNQQPLVRHSLLSVLSSSTKLVRE